MSLKDVNKESFVYLLIFIIYFTFFLGFFLNENSAGGGGYLGDIRHIWNNQKNFNNNTLSYSINSTASGFSELYKSSRPPLNYILNKFLNPFANNIENLRLSVFILSIIFPIFLCLGFFIKFNEVNKKFLFLLSIIVLIDPFYRTSSFWALEENYGLGFVFISFLIFYKIKENKHQNNFLILLLSFISSCCVYFCGVELKQGTALFH